MNTKKDLRLRHFSRLIALRRVEMRDGKAGWICKCACGEFTTVGVGKLMAGTTRSCGCLAKERIRKMGFVSYKHGGKGTRLYRIFHNLRQRCYNPSNTAYKYYGQRGIQICEQWRGRFEPFQEWALANGYNDDLTIDRINSNGNYEPYNCQWITKSENSKKRNRESPQARNYG